MTASGPRSEARAAVAARSWEVARAAFARADAASDGAHGALTAAELEAWGLAALLAGDDEECDAVRERAHHAHLLAGDAEGAARVAFWLGLTLLMRGEPARARGWFARPRSVLGDAGFATTVWHGYERLDHGMRALFAGEAERGRALLADAVTVAVERHDPDLELLARNGHGQALLALGRAEDGMAELDEVMVLATTGTASPQAVGQVYCAAILACRGCLDLARSVEWTDALSRWCADQPGLVHFRGQCAIHRSEVLQLRGLWDAAVDEVTAVLDRLGRHPDRRDAARGMAHYQRGELHRVRGESRAAERAYREASAAGLDPQPGLALLRAAQGRAADATAALERASAETRAEFLRARLLPAQVEVALAAGDVERARAASADLRRLAALLRSAPLDAVSAQCTGAVALADGDPRAAVGPLRAALRTWSEVGAPYDAARCRVLVARACRMLGDAETAELEAQAARRAFVDLGARHDASLLEAEASGRPGAPDGLTPREVEVLRLLATGLTNREIAARLVLSERTVARHAANIFLKVGVGSRSAATAYAYDVGLV